MLEEIIKNIPINVLVITTDNIIEYSNIECCGYSPSEITGLTIDRVISSEYVCRDIERWVKYSCETKQKVNLYVKLRDNYFNDKNYNVYIYPLDSVRAITSWINIDKYNTKNNNIKSENKNKTEEIFKAKIEAINILSHEIRTPLTSILSMAENLSMKLKGSSLYESMEIIRISAERLKSFLLNIMDFTSDSFSSPLTFEKFSFHQFAEELCQRHRKNALKSNTILYVNCNIKETVLVSGNELYLWRIMNTILNYTIKHIRDGKVELDINPVSIKDNKISVGFEIKISGNGDLKKHLLKIKKEPFVVLNENSNVYCGDATYSFSLLNFLLSELNGKIEIFEGEPFVIKIDIPFEIVNSTESGEKDDH